MEREILLEERVEDVVRTSSSDRLSVEDVHDEILRIYEEREGLFRHAARRFFPDDNDIEDVMQGMVLNALNVFKAILEAHLYCR